MRHPKMLFAIRFTDYQDRKSVREANLESHFSWLVDRKHTILVAGSLRQEPTSNPIGALWIVEANTEEVVEAFYNSDSFGVNGLRKEVEILHWSKAFPDHQVLV